MVFVIGSSLKVFPFAGLVTLIKDDVPLILINRENPGVKRKLFLHVPGDIDDTIVNIAKEIGWDLPKFEKKAPKPVDIKIWYIFIKFNRNFICIQSFNII